MIPRVFKTAALISVWMQLSTPQFKNFHTIHSFFTQFKKLVLPEAKCVKKAIKTSLGRAMLPFY